VPADLIIYAIVAAGLVFWLRGTLGTRQEGDEPANPPSPLPDIESIQAAIKDEGEALPLKTAETAQDQIQDIANDKTGIIAIDNKDAENDLAEIMDADKDFDLKFFFTAAQDVFVMVVEAFADGDLEALESMLEPQVFDAFKAAIDQRADDGHTAQSEIHAIQKAHIIEAKLDKKMAFITLRFVADETSVTMDKDDKIIAGHPEKTSRMTDIWTFARDIKSRDPRWFVQETRGDFDGDNDIIPNA